MLQSAAIALTLQIESLIAPYNPDALYAFAPASTPVFENVYDQYSNPPGCCMWLVDLYYYAGFVETDDLNRIYINPYPMVAIINEAEGAVSVSVTEQIFQGDHQVGTNEVVFYWKPDPIHGQSSSCYLQLDRIETRNPLCEFNEPVCPP